MGKHSSSGVRSAAAGAVAAAGMAAAGAVVAGKVAHDRAERAEHRRRAFRLHGDEPPGDGIRRIARGQIDGALEHLRDGADGESVHEVRKALKRERALVRLVRDQLGTAVAGHENARLRDAGRQLAGTRDAKVLLETLDALVERYADELPAHPFAPLRAALVAEQAADAPPLAAVRAELDAARTRVGAWPLAAIAAVAVLGPGFGRIYRRGRKALRAARKDRDAAALHELRKRTKDLWHAAQVVRPASPTALRKLARRAHALSDVIGEDHDLAVLDAAAAARSATLAPDELKHLRKLIRRRRKRLQRKAIKRARKLYAAKPRRLVRSVGLAP